MKRIVCLLLVICFVFSLTVVAFADSYSDPDTLDEVVINDGGGRPEETEWVFRCWNGLLQMRLWSITYGYWLTEWETIGTC
jgi:hypothetical protein